MSRNRARPQRDAADFTGIKANKEENKTLHTSTPLKRGYGCISFSVSDMKRLYEVILELNAVF